jgi:hypothetical protein
MIAGSMTRTERTPDMAVPEPIQGRQCNMVITLHGIIYRCRVRCGHGGAHDAFAVHTDGVLVRW